MDNSIERLIIYLGLSIYLQSSSTKKIHKDVFSKIISSLTDCFHQAKKNHHQSAKPQKGIPLNVDLSSQLLTAYRILLYTK